MSSPHCFPEHVGWHSPPGQALLTHAPPPGQVPQPLALPQPSSPHCLPEQLGVHGPASGSSDPEPGRAPESTAGSVSMSAGDWTASFTLAGSGCPSGAPPASLATIPTQLHSLQRPPASHTRLPPAPGPHTHDSVAPSTGQVDLCPLRVGVHATSVAATRPMTVSTLLIDRDYTIGHAVRRSRFGGFWVANVRLKLLAKSS